MEFHKGRMVEKEELIPAPPEPGDWNFTILKDARILTLIYPFPVVEWSDKEICKLPVFHKPPQRYLPFQKRSFNDMMNGSHGPRNAPVTKLDRDGNIRKEAS